MFPIQGVPLDESILDPSLRPPTGSQFESRAHSKRKASKMLEESSQNDPEMRVLLKRIEAGPNIAQLTSDDASKRKAPSLRDRLKAYSFAKDTTSPSTTRVVRKGGT
jgi:hypothetical protein